MTDENLADIAVTQSEQENDEQNIDAGESSEESTDTGVKPVEGEGGESTNNAVEGSDQESTDTYADLSLPDGLTLDGDLLSKAVPVFKELGLTKDQAQKLVDLKSEEVKAGEEGRVEAFNQLKQDWQEQAKSDNEIGGDNFEQSVSNAREALGKFGTPELTKLLNDYGMGNHPEVIRFMAKVGHLTKEDVPGSTGAPSTPKKDRVSILYPYDSN